MLSWSAANHALHLVHDYHTRQSRRLLICASTSPIIPIIHSPNEPSDRHPTSQLIVSMVEVQRPFSMPSRVVLDLPIPKEPQPPLPQCPSDLEIYCPRLDRTNRGDIVRSLIQLGLQTPPRDMSGVDHNAQISKHGGTQYKSIPAVKSYPAPYQAHTGNHLNGRPVTQPRPTYHHGNQHPNSSPNENAVIHQQPSRRQNSGDGNSIATYLQIPESISSSKGSLSDFTARVCL